jgi:hypothetical protein
LHKAKSDMDHDEQEQAYATGAASPAAAVAPKTETLYEQLLRYHNEHDPSDDESDHQRRRGKPKGTPPPTVLGGGMDDKKPAARRTPMHNRLKATPNSNLKSPPSSSIYPGSGHEGTPGSSVQPALDTRLNAARATANSGGGKKPGIVAVEQAAMHPNSAMYRAAYGGGSEATTPSSATATRRPPPVNTTRNDALPEATALRSSGGSCSHTVKESLESASRRASSRSPTIDTAGTNRSSAPKLDHSSMARSKPQVMDAPCVSARTPLAKVIPSPMMNPPSGSQSNPKFFESIDDSLDVKPAAPGARSRSPKMGRKTRKGAMDRSGHREKQSKGKGALDRSDHREKTQDQRSALDRSDHREKQSKPKGALDRSDHREKTQDWRSALDWSGHREKQSKPKGALDRSDHREKTQDQRSALDRSGHREKESKRKGALDRSDHREKTQDQRSALDRSGHREIQSDPRQNKFSREHSLSTGDMPLSSEISGSGRHTPPSASSDHLNRMMIKPHPADHEQQRPRLPGRSKTTGHDNRKAPPQYAVPNPSPDVLSRPKDTSRTVGDPAAVKMMTANHPRHYSHDGYDLDADLKLALELSRRGSGESDSAHGPRTARPPANYGTHPATSPHPVSHDAPFGPSKSSMGHDGMFVSPKQQNQPKRPVSLNDHFSSSFAQDARTKLAEDEDSLADVLLALKLSAEEDAAARKGKPKERSHLRHGAKRQSTSIRELLQLERATTKQETGDESSVTTKDSSVIDLVAAGISTNASSADAEKQLRILQQIREEEEKRQIEMALKASKSTDDSIDADLDAELKLALEVSRNEAQQRSSSDEFVLSQQKAMEEFSARRSSASSAASSPERPNNSPPLDHDRSKAALLQRGTAETHRAISTGQVQVVTCRGCNGRLQAPLSYSLVFCPKCQTISPTGA